MTESIISRRQTNGPYLIGMIHLGALPGSPVRPTSLDSVVDRAVEDAQHLANAGFDAIMIENYNDTPFFKNRVPSITVAAMTRCALAIRAAAPQQALGINVLRNDAVSAMDIATVIGAQFIRVNVLTGAMVTDQGIVEGCSSTLLRHRADIRSQVEIWADIAVKHAAPIAEFSIEQLAQDTAWRGHADALILSGRATGAPTDPVDIAHARDAVPGIPIVVGSGATIENVEHLRADAVIVGTALKKNGQIHGQTAQSFAAHARGL